MFIVLTYSRCFILAYIVTSARIFKASVSLALSVWGRSIFSKTLWKHKTKQKKIAIRCCYLLTRQLFT